MSKEDEKVSLQKWVEEEKLRLDRFAAHWAIYAPGDPEMYPSEMEMGEWDEQYRCWSE